MKTRQKIFTFIALALTFTFNTQAGGYDDATWYVSMDVEQARAKLVPHLSQEIQNNNDFEFTDLTPVGVNQVTIYGQNKDSSTITAVLSGQLGDFGTQNFINELEKQAGEDAHVFLKESTKNNGHSIDHFVFKGGEKDKSFYTAKLDASTVVASFNKDEVLNWSNNIYSTKLLHQTGLVTVHVKIESALMHMGADIEAGAQPFQSHMFQKIKQVSASIIEDQDDLLIEAALVTEDEASAKQVSAVINGVIAMNDLSETTSNNQALNTLLSNLNINNKGNHVMVLSHLPLAVLSEIDLD